MCSQQPPVFYWMNKTLTSDIFLAQHVVRERDRDRDRETERDRDRERQRETDTDNLGKGQKGWK